MKTNVCARPMVLKLEEPCKNCGSFLYEVRYRSPHVGLYCKCCGKWIKWLSKKERNRYVDITLSDVSVAEEIIQCEEDMEDLPW